MKKFQVGAIVLAAALVTSACSKGDDGATAATNETIAGDENGTAGTLDDNAIADDLGNASDTATDNAAAAPTNSL